uniref:Uncharacterized protein n=1 Tax=Avena sativa TaxID=4498 RepID=A0ACD5ZK78_AVESA
MQEEVDGNWDDGHDLEEEMGFRQGSASKVGGVVDMEDDVYLEFDDDEEEVTEAPEPGTWKLLARYMANFKPNTKSMFDRFTDEVWKLRTGIRYSERGKNYYMITLFSKGDYDFVMRGGPWIFKRHALIVKKFDAAAQPSESVLDSVPVWVRIYDVPWRKQNKTWGMRYGDSLGEALEVDVPSKEQDQNEFLRVRVELPYDKRLQTQITTEVKGKPGEVKVFKLKYERVPYYCSHCGFMGHHKEECEKERRGIPSLDYDAYELRCSPYKKYVHRAHYIPPAWQASARRNLSFASFGTSESHKSGRSSREFQRQNYRHERRSPMPQVGSHGADDEDEMRPLMDATPPREYDGEQIGLYDGFEEEGKQIMADVEMNLADKVGALEVAPLARSPHSGRFEGRAAKQTFVQFPDDEAPLAEEAGFDRLKIMIAPGMMEYMQNIEVAGVASGSGSRGPTYSDMIPAMQNLSNLQVSFGSATDVTMTPADTILGKRAAEESEVQGPRLDLGLSLNYGAPSDGMMQQRGKMQGARQEAGDTRNMELVYSRAKNTRATGHVPSSTPDLWDGADGLHQHGQRQAADKQGEDARARRGKGKLIGRGRLAATGHGASGKLTRPNVWSCQGQ